MIYKFISILLLAEIALCFPGSGFFEFSFWTTYRRTIANLTYASQKTYPMAVYGVEEVGRDVYVLLNGSSSIYALNQNLMHRMTLTYEEFKKPYDMVSVDNKLFILEAKETGTEIYKIDTDCRFNITKWPYAKDFTSGSLSASCDGNLILSVRDTKRVIEFRGRNIIRNFTTNGTAEVLHAIKLYNGNYAVASGSKPDEQHQVCNYDATGKLIGCFGGQPGSSTTQLNAPTRLMQSPGGNVLVADTLNKRVVELNADLTYNRTLLDETSGNGFANPYRFSRINDRSRTIYLAANVFDAHLGYPTSGAVISYKF